MNKQERKAFEAGYKAAMKYNLSKLNKKGSNDGWNIEDEGFANILDTLDAYYNIRYELNNCVRGTYTGCETNDELADYIEELCEKMSYFSDMIREDF